MSKDIFVFSHIPKNAGTSVTELIRSANGLRHVDVIQRSRQGLYQYGYNELRSDMKLMPWAVSLAGHCIQPWQSYHEFDERMFWFVMLREPVARFISQYAYQVSRYNLKEDFFQWKKKYRQDNAQVVHLAGEPDLQAAKEILRDKIDLIGFVDSIDDSVNFLNKRLGISSVQNNNIKKKNQSPNHLRKNIIDNYHIYSEAINECNALDFQLYDYAKDIYEKKLFDAYASLSPLKEVSGATAVINKYTNIAFRNIVYKNYTRFV